MQGPGRGLSGATEASVKSECNKDGWVTIEGGSPLSWWFSDGVVLVSASSVGSILLGWVKSAVGWAITSISSSEFSCICSSSHMWPSSFGMLAKLAGNFSGNLAYSESPSLSPELAADMTSLSELAGNVGVAAGPIVGHERFEYLLPLQVAVGMEVSEATVLVST